MRLSFLFKVLNPTLNNYRSAFLCKKINYLDLVHWCSGPDPYILTLKCELNLNTFWLSVAAKEKCSGRMNQTVKRKGKEMNKSFFGWVKKSDGKEIRALQKKWIMGGERSGVRFQEKKRNGGDERVRLTMGERCGCMMEMEGRE